jgi:hypothetical protein
MFMRLVLPFLFLALALEARAREMSPLWMIDLHTPPERTLDLVYVDVQDAATQTIPAFTREASRILAQVGMNARWRSGGRGVVAGNNELTVVLMADIGSARIPTHVLGATVVGEKAVRTVWIYLPHVAATLGVDADPFRPADIHLLAVALGRVAAHEILHALAPRLPHSRSGLMAERLGRSALLGPDVEVPLAFRQALYPVLVRRALAD